jgi:hypothetical protein
VAAAKQVAAGLVTDHDSGTTDRLITAKLAAPPPRSLDRLRPHFCITEHYRSPQALENLDGTPQ